MSIFMQFTNRMDDSDIISCWLWQSGSILQVSSTAELLVQPKNYDSWHGISLTRPPPSSIFTRRTSNMCMWETVLPCVYLLYKIIAAFFDYFFFTLFFSLFSSTYKVLTLELFKWDPTTAIWEKKWQVYSPHYSSWWKAWVDKMVMKVVVGTATQKANIGFLEENCIFVSFLSFFLSVFAAY